MAIDQTPLATARRVLDDDPSLAAFIVSKSDAAQADDDLARLASLYWRNGCTRAEALELISAAEYSRRSRGSERHRIHPARSAWPTPALASHLNHINVLTGTIGVREQHGLGWRLRSGIDRRHGPQVDRTNAIL